MAKKTVITTETEDAEDVVTGSDAPDPIENDADVIRALVDIEGADSVRWQVHRVSHPNPGFCGELATVEMSLERIQSDFGPGRYQVKGFKAGGGYFKSARISIADTRKKDALAEALASMKTSAPTAQLDLMPLVLAMMQSQSSIMAAVVSKPDSQKRFPTEALIAVLPALLPALKDLMGGKNGDDGTAKLLQAIELVEKLKGDGADKTGSTWVDIVRDALPQVGSVVKDAMGAMQRRPEGAPQAIQATVQQEIPAQIAQVQIPVYQEGEMKFTNPVWQRSQIAFLIEKAKLGREVDLYVDLILDEIPAFIPPAIVLEHIRREDWWQILSAFEPAILPYQPWFETLRATLISSLTDESENDNE